MNTYRINDQQGRTFAFEIANVYIAPRKIAALLSEIEGVSNIRVRRLFSSSPDTHVQFTFFEVECIVFEPFGDSSRYWIGPKEEQDYFRVPIEIIEDAFKRYQPPILIKIFGDVLMLNFKSLFASFKR